MRTWRPRLSLLAIEMLVLSREPYHIPHSQPTASMRKVLRLDETEFRCERKHQPFPRMGVWRWGDRSRISPNFLDAVGRAHLGKDRINRRLCSIGKLDPYEWEFPPKPKWMRWPTHNRAEVKFDGCEEALEHGTAALMHRGLANRFRFRKIPGIDMPRITP
jgi:hypothetical protein